MRTDERLAELLGAAAAGELGDDERRELDAWCADDPAVRAERDAILGVVDRVDALRGDSSLTFDDPEPPRRLERAVVGATRERPWRGRRAALLLAAAAVLVGLGSVGTLVVQALTDGPPTGPPGTLGAVEPVDFAGAAADPAEVEAQVVAHTWGTEVVLHVDGLEPGTTYDVRLVDDAGREVGAGTFLGSEVHIDCRVNAAVLREDVRTLRITGSDGEVVRSAELPVVDG